MTNKKKPTGVGEDTAHRPLFITEDELAENWNRTFGPYYKEDKNAASKTRVEKKVRKSANISDEEVG